MPPTSGLKGRKMVVAGEPKKKFADVFPELGNGDFIIDQSDESEYMWFSSDSKSPSLLSSDDRSQSNDAWDMDWLDLHQFSTMSLKSGSYCVSSEETSPVVKTSSVTKVHEEDLQGGKSRASPTCSESTKSSSGRSLYESMFPVNYSTSIDTADSSPMGNWVSLIDLESQDFEWASDDGEGSSILDSDFPSPSFHIRRNLNMEKATKTPPNDSGDIWDGSEADEPIFWPFDFSSYSKSKWDSLCISPRRDDVLSGLGAHKGPHASKSIKHRLHQRNATPQQGSTTRKVTPAPKPTSPSISERRQVQSNNSNDHKLPKITKSRSKLGRSTMATYKSSEQKKPQFENGSTREDPIHGLLIAWEALGFDEVPIEEMVGLSEFDGHEGIDGEFNERGFCIDSIEM
ncbi:hypothetical protein QJS10_CPB04g01863 [Acorus calamus]|uniref:Uncharacterized protein n=1 Tax=Acorus calamus TaxID=4465 RepID=A0AAV9EZJ5_ACOCL|nr:hypothetical protein QJS10_CPB04g01863 [Acorus calamus]